MTEPNDEVVMYLIFRADLNLPKGKLAAQAGHAVQRAMRLVEQEGGAEDRASLTQWEAGSYTKIALKVGDLNEWAALCSALDNSGILYARVVDEGRTVIEPGTTTALGIQPLPKSQVTPFVGKLRLL